MSEIEIPKKAIPGQLLCPILAPTTPKITQYTAGPGTKIIQYSNGVEAITSTRLGSVYLQNLPEDTENERVVVEVSVGEKQNENGRLLPREKDIVLCRVVKISLQRANVEIIALENENLPVDSGVGTNGHSVVGVNGGSGGATFTVSQGSSDLGETFRGIIRSQDVRATDRDKVKIIESFKPGDIVRAQILSLGDGIYYYLTTARNDLGVVFAKSDNGAGGLMYATDWQTMTAPTTGVTEKRKCAKPFE